MGILKAFVRLSKGAAFLAAFVVATAFTTPLSSAQSSIPNDPYFHSKGSWQQQYDDQWALKAIGFTPLSDPSSAWAIEDGRSNSVIVAVIDTGIDFHHPDLARENLWRNDRERPNGKDDDGNGYVDDLIGWNFIDNDNNPWDYAGHGTHVAGVMAARADNGEGIAGINRGVKIMPLKVLNFIGRGSSTHIAEAIYYAVKNKARIINLSLGGESISEIERKAIDYAFANNVLVVVAAGNDGRNTDNLGPAALESALTVGASDTDNRKAGFSNWGDAVDIVAPGIDIVSLRARRTDLALVAEVENYKAGENFVGRDNRYYRISGTSFAAPFVSGVASLILARHPDYSALDVRNALLQTARDIDVPGKDRNTGYGLLDARKALAFIQGFLLEAQISGIQVVQAGGKPVVRVLGTAEADQLAKAWIDIGEGENPKKWKKASDALKKAVKDGTLDDLDVNLFRDSKVWTLRLTVEHKNGEKREARFIMKLG